MDRRKFLEYLPALAAIPMTLQGISFYSMADALGPLQRLAAQCPNDRVLILLQLHGGNDGINTLIPLANYDQYYNVRPNIGLPENGARKIIPLDSTLPSASQVALHPDMVGVKSLYDQGLVHFIQGVSYENNNGSHFRGRDILFMGGGSNDYLTSGWAGRYLKDQYAPQRYPENFPNADMPDPLSLEFNDDLSLVFHQDDNIPTSIAIRDPESFFDLVNTLPGYEDKPNVDPRGIPPAALEQTLYAKELRWILNLEQKTEEYHSRILQTYQAGKQLDPNIVYPTTYPLNAPAQRARNPISQQFKIIANLIHGGSKTKLFLVRMGGFDTHARQVESYDPTMGNHAALMYHISSTMQAFQQDLQARGIADRVLTITTSEFGRRIYSNGSYGTDHGEGAPMLLFGQPVQGGVLGSLPDMSEDNVAMQFDYRQIYATILKDWMCVEPSKVDAEFGILWGDYPGRGVTLPLIQSLVTSSKSFTKERFYVHPCYPNPASTQTTLKFFMITPAEVQIQLYTVQGKWVKQLVKSTFPAGESSVVIELQDIPAGSYIYKVEAGSLKDSKALIVQK
ncbi:MAG: DUF1501 domain-containing protein [Cytophagaceae bacterium]|jgi:uncharacterized protein (DUF1501 family)|nr:DUF1501 domain-containing protein [Cytophagaceae bacterium]